MHQVVPPGALFDFQPKLRFGVKIKSFHCEFTVRCKHLTLWDLQLKAADLTPMQLSAALEFAMECCIGYANAAKLFFFWAAGATPAAMLHWLRQCSNTTIGLPPIVEWPQLPGRKAWNLLVLLRSKTIWRYLLLVQPGVHLLGQLELHII